VVAEKMLNHLNEKATLAGGGLLPESRAPPQPGLSDLYSANIHPARSHKGGGAMAAVWPGGKLGAPTFDKLSGIPEVTEVRMIDLSGG
jgi:hypothetical protein